MPPAQGRRHYGPTQGRRNHHLKRLCRYLLLPPAEHHEHGVIPMVHDLIRWCSGAGHRRALRKALCDLRTHPAFPALLALFRARWDLAPPRLHRRLQEIHLPWEIE